MSTPGGILWSSATRDESYGSITVPVDGDVDARWREEFERIAARHNDGVDGPAWSMQGRSWGDIRLNHGGAIVVTGIGEHTDDETLRAALASVVVLASENASRE